MRPLLLCDGVNVTTGFGTVAQYVAAELVRRGHDVHQITGLDLAPGDAAAYRAQGVTPYFPRKDDPHGLGMASSVLPAVRPDLLVLIQHPGGAANWLVKLQEAGYGHLPYVLYSPAEGAPMQSDWGVAFRDAAAAFTCTAWGSEMLRRQFGLDVPFVYHGVDTSVFKPLDQWQRRQVRQRLGWDGKFVCVYVARNAERKQHVRLLDALRLLVSSGVTDVRLYLHCRPFEDYTLRGWHLGQEVGWRGLEEYVEFAPQDRTDHGMPADTLAERLASADLCVFPSSLEGFGIPLLEAMACGLPIAVTDDHGNMAELTEDAAFWRLRVTETTSWWNGVRVHHVDPADTARAIVEAKSDRLRLATFAGAALRRARQSCFRWDGMARVLADAVEKSSTAYQPLAIGAGA